MEEHDVDELFRMLDSEIAARGERVEKLQRTVHAFKRADQLFDAGNIAKVESVLAKRQEELRVLCRDVEAAKNLFSATVQGLEEKIRSKEAVLLAVDEELGTISGEEELLQHFAQEQAQLKDGILRAKDTLVRTICNKLGPTLFANAGAAAAAAAALASTRM
jgi:capsule polysaccharide export protein KpsE/RkpR